MVTSPQKQREKKSFEKNWLDQLALFFFSSYDKRESYFGDTEYNIFTKEVCFRETRLCWGLEGVWKCYGYGLKYEIMTLLRVVFPPSEGLYGNTQNDQNLCIRCSTRMERGSQGDQSRDLEHCKGTENDLGLELLLKAATHNLARCWGAEKCTMEIWRKKSSFVPLLWHK